MMMIPSSFQLLLLLCTLILFLSTSSSFSALASDIETGNNPITLGTFRTDLALDEGQFPADIRFMGQWNCACKITDTIAAFGSGIGAGGGGAVFLTFDDTPRIIANVSTPGVGEFYACTTFDNGRGLLLFTHTKPAQVFLFNTSGLVDASSNVLSGSSGTSSPPALLPQPAPQQLLHLTLGSDEDQVRSAVSNGTHSFLGLWLGPAPRIIICIRNHDLARAGTIELQNGEENLWAVAASPSNPNIALWAALLQPGMLIKTHLGNMSRAGSLVFNTSEDFPRSIFILGDMAFVGLGTVPGVILKILGAISASSPLTRAGRVSLAPVGGNLVFTLVYHDGALLAGTYEAPIKIVKLNVTDTSNVTIVGYTVSTGGQKYGRCAVTNGAFRILIGSFSDSPGIVGAYRTTAYPFTTTTTLSTTTMTTTSTTTTSVNATGTTATETTMMATTTTPTSVTATSTSTTAPPTTTTVTEPTTTNATTAAPTTTATSTSTTTSTTAQATTTSTTAVPTTTSTSTTKPPTTTSTTTTKPTTSSTTTTTTTTTTTPVPTTAPPDIGAVLTLNPNAGTNSVEDKKKLAEKIASNFTNVAAGIAADIKAKFGLDVEVTNITAAGPDGTELAVTINVIGGGTPENSKKLDGLFAQVDPTKDAAWLSQTVASMSLDAPAGIRVRGVKLEGAAATHPTPEPPPPPPAHCFIGNCAATYAVISILALLLIIAAVLITRKYLAWREQKRIEYEEEQEMLARREGHAINDAFLAVPQMHVPATVDDVRVTGDVKQQLADLNAKRSGGGVDQAGDHDDGVVL